jgi:hypothetical protein
MQILGITDSVNTCDCCGKSNLAKTVVVDLDNGIQYFGTTCVKKHTGFTFKQVLKNENDKRQAEIKEKNEILEKSKEATAYYSKIAEADRLKLFGKARLDTLREFHESFMQKKFELGIA